MSEITKWAKALLIVCLAGLALGLLLLLGDIVANAFGFPVAIIAGAVFALTAWVRVIFSDLL